MKEINSEIITVKVLFFGAARDAAGIAEVDVGSPAPASVSTVKEKVFSEYHRVSLLGKSLMIAVNEEYATNDVAVKQGDVVAFLPPVSGG